MPIQITLPPPGTAIGPFVGVNLRSDFIGPLPTGSEWRVQVYQTPEPTGGEIIMAGFSTATGVTGSVVFSSKATPQGMQTDRFVAPVDGATVHVTANLLENPTTVIDSGTIDTAWSSTMGQQLLPLEITGGTGGLTNEQALQLAQTNFSTFTSTLLDQLTLQELTNGPSQGPINAFLPNMVWGIIVRIANVPEELVPVTPDGDYWVKTLCVVRLFRGQDLWKRYPIHTSSKIIDFAAESIVTAVTEATLTQWLLNLSVQVTFLPGVTGQVFLTAFP